MFALVSQHPKIIFTWTAWHEDRHQRVFVCYNGLLFFTFGFLTYNWFNFRCDIQVLSSIHLAEVSFTLVNWRSTDREQQQRYKTDILLTATIMVSVARKQVFFHWWNYFTVGPNDLKMCHLGQVCTLWTFSYETLHTALDRCPNLLARKTMSKYHIVTSYLMTSQKRVIKIF